MGVTLEKNARLTYEVLSNPMRSDPFSPSIHLAGEGVSQSESQQPQLSGNWQKQENSEHGDSEEDIRLHELMENVKRYIRNIDISDL